MDNYRSVLFYLSQFVALFAVASFGTPKLSSQLHLCLALAAGGAWLVYCGYLYFKEKRPLSTMFLWSSALIPWVFYGELLMLGVSPLTLEGELDEGKLKHVIVVFNLFRYVMLGMAAGITLKDLLRALRS
ncbi:MAG: hypothetical protein K6F05_08370 [Succinivibrio sp.]|nr:hypothetical protein [Succinivibrio sp.]